MKKLECVNWDEEQPATIKSKGRNHAVSRKVLTKASRPVTLVTKEIDNERKTKDEQGNYQGTARAGR